MANLLESLKTSVPSVEAATKTRIIAPTRQVKEKIPNNVRARNVVVDRLKENLAVLDAHTNNKPLPQHPPKKEGGRARNYACWFELDPATDTYEFTLKYGTKTIDGIFGSDNDGRPLSVLTKIPRESLRNLIEKTIEIIENGDIDETLLAVQASFAARMKKNTSKQAT